MKNKRESEEILIKDTIYEEYSKEVKISSSRKKIYIGATIILFALLFLAAFLISKYKMENNHLKVSNYIVYSFFIIYLIIVNINSFESMITSDEISKAKLVIKNILIKQKIKYDSKNIEEFIKAEINYSNKFFDRFNENLSNTRIIKYLLGLFAFFVAILANCLGTMFANSMIEDVSQKNFDIQINALLSLLLILSIIGFSFYFGIEISVAGNKRKSILYEKAINDLYFEEKLKEMQIENS